MTLTGKAKEDFEKWYMTDHLGYDEVPAKFMKEAAIPTFEKKHPSEKYGVFVDWFDSVGMTETVELELSMMAGGHNRQEARLWAIEKQDKRYNRNKT